MSDDLMRLLESKIEVWSSKSIYGQAAARIREQRELLDECERAFQEIINSGGSRGSVAHAEFVDALSIRVLHKLRAQEKADEVEAD